MNVYRNHDRSPSAGLTNVRQTAELSVFHIMYLLVLPAEESVLRKLVRAPSSEEDGLKGEALGTILHISRTRDIKSREGQRKARPQLLLRTFTYAGRK